jgi:hypothetical protein
MIKISSWIGDFLKKLLANSSDIICNLTGMRGHQRSPNAEVTVSTLRWLDTQKTTENVYSYGNTEFHIYAFNCVVIMSYQIANYCIFYWKKPVLSNSVCPKNYDGNILNSQEVTIFIQVTITCLTLSLLYYLFLLFLI